MCGLFEMRFRLRAWQIAVQCRLNSPGQTSRRCMTISSPPPLAGYERRPSAVMPAIQIPPEPARKSERLSSLDIFRGITIAAMLLVNNPGKGEPVYWPLEHADAYGWHGWTPTDLIFPFFLFI